MIRRNFRPLGRPLATALLAATIAALNSQTSAQTYLSNTIRILVPTSAGTPPDIISRIIATDVSESEGWKMII